MAYAHPAPRPVLAQQRGLAAIGGLAAAVVAFFVGPVLGFFLALFAILLGIVGFLRAASPRVSGGIMSIGAILLGVVAVVVKIIHGALALVF
jgi:uncharacterized membrane protein YccC